MPARFKKANLSATYQRHVVAKVIARVCENTEDASLNPLLRLPRAGLTILRQLFRTDFSGLAGEHQRTLPLSGTGRSSGLDCKDGVVA
jgi:hypothetical protein